MAEEKFGIDPVTKQTITKDLKDIKDIRDEITSALLQSSKEGIDSVSEFLKAFKDATSEGFAFTDVITDLEEKFGASSAAIGVIVDALKKAEVAGKSVEDEAEKITGAFRLAKSEVEKLALSLDSSLKIMQNMGATDLAATFGKMKKAAEEMGKAFELLTAGSGMKGLLFLLSVVSDIFAVTKQLRDASQDINRIMYDANAAMGKMGERQNDLLKDANELATRWAMTPIEVMKVEKGLAGIGANQSEIKDLTKDILDLTTAWTEITPEKQMQMMQQLMHSFGASAKDAKNAMFALYKEAENVASAMGITNISSKDFADHAMVLEQSAGRLGYNLGDAKAILSAMVATMKDAKGVVDIESATKLTSGIMGLGVSNMGMQAYMMSQFGGPGGKGVGGTAIEQAGSFIMAGAKEKTDAQMSMFQQLMEGAGGGKVPTTKAGMAGAAELISQQFQLGMDPTAIKEMVEKVGTGKEGIEKLKSKLHEQLEASEKSRISNSAANALIGQNTKEIVTRTKSVEEILTSKLADIGGTLKDILHAFLHPEDARSLEKQKKEQERAIEDAKKKTDEMIKEVASRKRMGEVGFVEAATEERLNTELNMDSLSSAGRSRAAGWEAIITLREKPGADQFPEKGSSSVKLKK
jgi:hypothetical protein